jgi:hypothetical protein
LVLDKIKTLPCGLKKGINAKLFHQRIIKIMHIPINQHFSMPIPGQMLDVPSRTSSNIFTNAVKMSGFIVE